MRYAVFTPGKRLRPFLLISAADIFSVDRNCSKRAAAALEMIHTYSLVHDDLPAMDNDDYRRGQESCHKKFGEATAILVGDGLLTLAFEVLASSDTHPNPAVRCDLIKNLACAAGFKGMVGRLNRMKTGALFIASCEMGAILGKASDNLRASLRAYAQNVGIAFQILDDIEDLKQDKEEKLTYVNLLGINQSKEQARLLCTQASEYIRTLEEKATSLQSFADYLMSKINSIEL
jgi:farnesyl diphosphate synthase